MTNWNQINYFNSDRLENSMIRPTPVSIVESPFPLPEFDQTLYIYIYIYIYIKLSLV